MTEQEIRLALAEVLAGIAPEADLAAVGDGEELRDALDLDSMDFLNFLIRLHERTGIAIPEVDAPKLHTLGGAVSYLVTASACPAPPRHTA